MFERHVVKRVNELLIRNWYIAFNYCIVILRALLNLRLIFVFSWGYSIWAWSWYFLLICKWVCCVRSLLRLLLLDSWDLVDFGCRSLVLHQVRVVFSLNYFLLRLRHLQKVSGWITGFESPRSLLVMMQLRSLFKRVLVILMWLAFISIVINIKVLGKFIRIIVVNLSCQHSIVCVTIEFLWHDIIIAVLLSLLLAWVINYLHLLQVKRLGWGVVYCRQDCWLLADWQLWDVSLVLLWNLDRQQYFWNLAFLHQWLLQHLLTGLML